ncbi:unnamed protein product, partial [Nippostrongylus brasiliensis]|uniref:protein-tyrosine-phosphatase n=1 Tax=Nippostrongylus brasiliensis TaxID=27835 RepID=A0A0N4XG23_NIPBR
MYHVGGGDEFRTVGELLQHYNNNPMVEEGSQRVVHLMNRIQQVDDQFSSRREGKKEQNISRNRYKNIVPFDHTRVILKDVPPNESDYINASYIKVTSCIFPANLVKNSLKSKMRTVITVLDSGLPQRELFHLQFIGWPDHGCPEQPESVLRFLDAVDVACKKAISTQGPVIVHCSAGIGRTGTFIVIDILLNQIRNRGSSCPIDIPRTVMKIREQRSRMVQTEAQYVFLYRAISCYIAMQSR